MRQRSSRRRKLSAKFVFEDLEAAKDLPVDQLAISPQCGFSSDIELVQLPKDVQWRKFESLHCRAGLKN